MSFPGLTRTQINALISTALVDYYTSDEVDAAFAAISGVYAPASHNHSASAITSGTLDAARLPDLSSVYAAVAHNHDLAYAALSHDHDSRYFTESEITTLLSGKSDTSHNHDSAYAALVHTHDDRYFTEAEITSLLSGKAESSHTHAASEIASGVLDNARVNWGAPSAIGGTTPAAGTFTSLAGTVTDAATNTVTDVLDVVHQSSSTPTTNFGTGLRFRGHSANNTLRDMGRLRFRWTTATDGTRTAEGILSIINSGTERDQIVTQAAQTAFYIGGSEVAKVNANGLDVTAGAYTSLYLKGYILAQALNGNNTSLGLGGGFTTTSIKSLFQLYPSGNATGNALRSIAQAIAIAGANTPAIGFGGEITFNLPSYNGGYYDNSAGASQLLWKYYSGDPAAATGLVSLQLRPKRGSVGVSFNQQGDNTTRVGINTEAPNNALDVVGTIQADGLRLDLTPTAETITPTHTITVSINGTNYKIPLVAA